MEKELEALVQKRYKLVEAHEENGFTDGIHALLTDLYPDTAHFIYELLQNAEDMDATTVRFCLNSNGIRFEHNGTKRSFTVEDIDAITNIGRNSLKKDDPTSIGKFGVGFKAVFAYTATPIIHSGKYHFKIENYFVPEFKGIEPVQTLDANGVEWTIFEFPFNNPQKPPYKARSECLNGLNALDTTSILFLRSIDTIEYKISSEHQGYIKRTYSNNPELPIESITLKNPMSKAETTSRWLKFQRFVDLIDDQGKKKLLSIGIAFAMEQTHIKTERVMPIHGKTFIYFPAEKEYSGLRFHINAPFASTVARDSVRACPENTRLIYEIAQLTTDSLMTIKNAGLMNNALFEVLPNKYDQLDTFYQPIRNSIFCEFKENEYLPRKDGRGYVTSADALIDRMAILDIFSDEDIQGLFGIHKARIRSAENQHSNANRFLQSLKIQEFTYSEFANVFVLEKRNEIEQYLEKRSSILLKSFYRFCIKAYKNMEGYLQTSFLKNLKQTRLIRSTKGYMYLPSQIYVLLPNTPLLTDTPIVDPVFVFSSDDHNKSENLICSEILYFFYDQLDIQKYGPKTEIENSLKKYANPIEINESYFRELLSFAKYNSKYNDVTFSKHKIFLYSTNYSATLIQECADQLYFGSEYGNPAGEVLAEGYSKNVLWDGYKKYYNEKELPQFITFAEKCGIQRELKIIEQSATKNPQFRMKLPTNPKLMINGTDSDYTISRLYDLLIKNQFELNKQIWNCLFKNGNERYSRYLSARFSPNGKAKLNKFDSTLIYWLKELPWVPNTERKLLKPRDITIENIHPEFPYDPNNILLSALHFGSAFSESTAQKRIKLEKEARAEGLFVITDEEYKFLVSAKAKLEANQKVAQASGRDLLNSQAKRAKPHMNEDDDFSADGVVNNLTKREKNIESTFKNRERMKPAQRKLFGRTSESTKEERNRLSNWYRGKCQMCGIVIIGADQNPHFIAKNIIYTRDLSDHIRNTTGIAWNSLCLCPNCAMKYDVCTRDLSRLYDQIMHKVIIEGNDKPIILSIELDNRLQIIKYDPRHFLALKKALQLIDEEFADINEQ